MGARESHVLLLTGQPGVGKTTAILKVAARVHGPRVSGFVTEEVRGPSGRRTGFSAVTFNGDERIIADAGREEPPRVGQYGVDVAAIDELAASELEWREDVDLYLVDEIGKMECLSQAFVRAMRSLLDSSKPVVATIGRHGGGLIAEAKARSDVELLEVTRKNRDALPGQVVQWLEQRGLVLLLTCFLSIVAPSTVKSQDPPVDMSNLQTRPERTEFIETSRYEDVVAMLAAIIASTNAITVDTFGYSFEGRALPVARWGEGPTRILVFANIHAGEVEGKEAALILLRDLTAGIHDDWRDSLTLWTAPIYNADGNERIALTNRPLQLGPLGGMGQRPNAQGLDLNRDFMKLEAPETRSLVSLVREVDPHIVVDLHTTDGTLHGYHLTYAPPLHPDTDPAIAGYLRETFLPAVTRALRESAGEAPAATLDGGTPATVEAPQSRSETIAELRAGQQWETWHYGNLPDTEVDGADDASAVRGWYSFSPEPRFSINYLGLRNRFGILSEAYSYLPFADRIAVTLRFVEGILDFAAAHGSEIRRRVEDADARRIAGADLSVTTDFERTLESVEILLGGVDTIPHPYTGERMLRRRDETRLERMAAFISFRATGTATAPTAYLVPAGQIEALEILAAHGVHTETLAEGRTLDVEEFRIAESRQDEEEFQGHRGRTLEGTWTMARHEIPVGTVVVPMDQPLARLAFHLLEPTASDGLVRWNLLDAALEGAETYPILRTTEPVAGS